MKKIMRLFKIIFSSLHDYITVECNKGMSEGTQAHWQYPGRIQAATDFIHRSHSLMEFFFLSFSFLQISKKSVLGGVTATRLVVI